MAKETKQEAWERGYRDGKVGRDEDAPVKSPFDAYAEDRYAYKDGYKEGTKDSKK